VEKIGLIINKVKDIEKGTVKVFQNVDFDDIEWVLEEYREESNMDFEKVLFQKDKDHEIWMYKGYIHVLNLGLKVHDIIFCNRIEEFEDYDEEFSGWMFFDDKTDELTYEESYTSLGAAILNGFHRKTEGMKCDVYI
jgi:hypothetical protein